MNEPDESFLTNCLFFTANRLGRTITKIAEEAFAPTGLSPMYGYLIRLAVGTPGISQKELAEKLSVAPSTLTRFVDKLETRKLVKREVEGKTVRIYPTPKGADVLPVIKQASKNLSERYEEVLGKSFASELSRQLVFSSEEMEK
ncbi:MarR family winged helix-turn-helix transcriptional regulator [Cohnella terricola]|uniref:MarR family transcriptional regulator n=1 Tax=Cohnella terricola TaxID=1289167 RepID=A0A559JT58_9BACL|nr:MarR family transcriptional regulator [Cohnella terricola]TVY03066.1 MarR family transcriptional regulator [Cohnella terricola]